MSKFRFLSIIFCAIAAVTLTSCWNDDDDSGLTPEQIQTCYNLTRGQHSGQLIFRKAGNTTNVKDNDTLNVTLNIKSDSSMVFQSVPSKAIASAIDTTTATIKADNLEAYKSIISQPAKDINCGIYYYSTNPISWLIYPASVTYENVAYKGKNSKIQIVFVANAYSIGSFNTTNNKMELQIVIAGAYVDGTYDSNLIPQSNARALFFTGK